ncbi:MAG TPA: hypothetical protein VIL20_23655 [Sandaracinaceae bacterium]
MARRGSWLAAVLLTGLLVSHEGRADSPHYRLEQGVELGPRMESVIARIAREFHRRTGRGIVVTSGTRTPREQAEAMYEKLRLGQSLTRLYRDYGAAAEIQAAYRAHRREGRAACVAAMARVIDAQVRRGLYVSRHLHASAADVRSRDMSRRERRIFEQIVRSMPEVSLLPEGVPPHFHLQLDR